MEQKEELLEQNNTEASEDMEAGEVVETDVAGVEAESGETDEVSEEQENDEEDPISKVIACTSFGLCAGLAIGCCISPVMSGVGLVIGAAVGFLCGKGIKKN